MRLEPDGSEPAEADSEQGRDVEALHDFHGARDGNDRHRDGPRDDDVRHGGLRSTAVGDSSRCARATRHGAGTRQVLLVSPLSLELIVAPWICAPMG